MLNTQHIWTEIYKPKLIKELTCNSQAVSAIHKWVLSFDQMKKEYFRNIDAKKKKQAKPKIKNTINIISTVENFNESDIAEKTDEFIETAKATKKKNGSCLLVTGNHGVGKTVTVMTILSELGYIVENINFNNIKSNVSLIDHVRKIVSSIDITIIVDSGNAKKKVAIVVDELESITSTSEKGYVDVLKKINDVEWLCPVIFISNNKHNKLLSEIKKTSTEIRLWSPFTSDLKRIMINIINKEKMKIRNSDVIDKIIEHSQYDIRRLIQTLHDLKYTYSDRLITKDMIDDYCSISNPKNVDIDLYKATEGLLYHYKSIDESLRLYETEKVLLPLMVHENYAKCIIDNIDDNNRDVHDITNYVMESLTTGDVVENYIYGDQNWNLQEIHGFHTCVATSFYICSKLPKNAFLSDLSFTHDLNKTSIKSINKKNITNAYKCFKNMGISDYIFMNKIIRKKVKNNEIAECMELFEGYDIKIDHIESLLKIDKIRNTKQTLTAKQKDGFSKYISK